MGLLAPALVAAVPAAADVPDTVPSPVPGTPRKVTADALPTAQINGVAWTQLIVGDTVYVGGEFTEARPAGAPMKSRSVVTRTNLLSYDLTTGVLSSWAPQVEGAVRDLAISPDGSTLYVAGSFTSVNGQARYRLAAFTLSTGALVGGFAPPFDYTVNTIVVTDRLVYAGGLFNYVGKATRSQLAAVNRVSGALTAWDPGADGPVSSMVRAPGGGPLVVGGSFSQLGRGTSPGDPVTARGLGAVTLGSAAVVPWSANERVQNYGSHAGITSLSTDGSQIYGTGYVFRGTGNLEGAFATDRTGSLLWVEDCHGDTYDGYATGGQVYTVGHAHNCSTVGGFADRGNPLEHQNAVAFTRDARGVLGRNTVSGYANWEGTPAPAIAAWFPSLTVGSYTGQAQAAWNVTGNGTYVVLGGEFPTVNNTPQQGLVRFAVKDVAPQKVGPQYGGSQVPLDVSVSGRTVTVSITANTDADDLRLTYRLVRDGVTVATVAANSTFWNRPTVTLQDTSVPSGRHTYQVRASDAVDNRAWSDPATVTLS